MLALIRIGLAMWLMFTLGLWAGSAIAFKFAYYLFEIGAIPSDRTPPEET